ncbi:hypothetical protein CRENBAI_007993 [Crenichthys baileyi]|uniref:Secreted protein n=1 Tax=Crenichthys baileyi TaxID=28760 RepID=A0AAV9RKL8_9TELE
MGHSLFLLVPINVHHRALLFPLPVLPPLVGPSDKPYTHRSRRRRSHLEDWCYSGFNSATCLLTRVAPPR